jgi:hypothetical protein
MMRILVATSASLKWLSFVAGRKHDARGYQTNCGDQQRSRISESPLAFRSSAKLRSRTFGLLLALLLYQAGSPCHNLIDSGVSFHVPPADSPFFGLCSYLVQNTWRPFHFIPHERLAKKGIGLLLIFVS